MNSLIRKIVGSVWIKLVPIWKAYFLMLTVEDKYVMGLV